MMTLTHNVYLVSKVILGFDRPFAVREIMDQVENEMIESTTHSIIRKMVAEGILIARPFIRGECPIPQALAVYEPTLYGLPVLAMFGKDPILSSSYNWTRHARNTFQQIWHFNQTTPEEFKKLGWSEVNDAHDTRTG